MTLRPMTLLDFRRAPRTAPACAGEAHVGSSIPMKRLQPPGPARVELVFPPLTPSEMREAAGRVVTLLRRNPGMNGEVALSYILWPNEPPSLEALDWALEQQRRMAA